MWKVAVPRLLLCRAGLHAAGPANVWNEGYFFSSCSQCARDLIRRPQGKWRPVPRRYKVVWKPKPPKYPVWSVAASAPEASGHRRISDLILDRDTRPEAGSSDRIAAGDH